MDKMKTKFLVAVLVVSVILLVYSLVCYRILNKRIEIERIDKIVMERAERRDLKYLAKLHNEVVRELEREKQDNIEKARKMKSEEIDIEEIEKETGLSRDEIEKL